MDGEDRGDVKGWEVKPSRVEMPRRRRRPAAQPGFRNQHEQQPLSSPTPRWMGNYRATLRVVGCRRLKKGSAALGDDWKGREQGRSTWEEDG